MSNFCLGVHLSLGPRPRRSLDAAAAEGVRCMQMFASSPGAWRPPVLRELKVSEVAEGRRELGIDPLVIHAIYLINLASEDRGLVERSVQSLIAALEAGAVLGARAVITHVGSHGGRGFEAVAAQVAAALRRAADSAAGDVELLLENSAGTGGIIGSRIEELSALLSLAGGHQRLGIALDTAHLCAAGWDFAGDPGAARRLTAEVDYLIGMDRLRIVHANDSKLPPGSRRDRHANVGDGFIGLVGFRSLLAEPRLTGVPWILETPDLDSRLDDSQRFISLRRLQALAQEHAAAVG
jgi:deoxyribonuclease-4